MADTKDQRSLITDGAKEWQGGKGHKALRINMAFSERSTEFIEAVSEAYKVNKTALVNRVLDIFQEEHPDVLATAQNYQRIAQELQKKKADK